MAYSNFTLQTVLQEFRLGKVDVQGLFSDIKPVEPSAFLTTLLERNMPLALTIDTEKAKSELIVAQVLVELREHFERRISLFSGIDFNVDDASGLVGVCDFLISLSPWQEFLDAPAIALVAAKNDNPRDGAGQCVAEMLAAQRFNAAAGNDIPCVYGATTTGVLWRFMKLAGQQLSVDMSVYSLERCDKVLGILASMVNQKA